MSRFVPPWIDRVNFIKTYYLSGCQQPLTVYAEFAKPIAIETALVFTQLSVTDIVKELFRPRGLRSARHARNGRTNRKYRYGIPDTDEMIARRLRTDLNIQRPKFNFVNGVFYEVTDLFDRLNYTIMLVELSTDLVYGTLLGIIENKPEFCPNIRRLRRSSGFMVEGAGPPSWDPFNQSIEHYKVGIISDTGFTMQLPPGKFNVTWGAKCLADDKPTKASFRIKQSSGAEKVYGQVTDLQLNSESPVDMLLNVDIQGPVNVTWQVNSDDGFWFSLESDLVVLEVL